MKIKKPENGIVVSKSNKRELKHIEDFLNKALAKQAMEKEQVNRISIASLLKSKGINPNIHSGNNFLYYSPLRNEKTPSFKVNRMEI